MIDVNRLKGDRMVDRFSPLPRLQSSRLLLRPLEIADTDDVYRFMSSPSVADQTMWQPHADRHASQVFVEQIIERYQTGRYFSWAVEELATHRVVGLCGFDGSWNQRHQRAELAYALNENYWGQGLMVEACTHILLFGFQSMGLHRVSAMCFTENYSSERVMQKLNMTYEGTLWDYVYVKGRFQTVKLYGLLAQEFFSKEGYQGGPPPHSLDR